MPTANGAVAADGDGAHYQAPMEKWTPSFAIADCRMQIKYGTANYLKLRVFTKTLPACKKARGFDTSPVHDNFKLSYRSLNGSIYATSSRTTKKRKGKNSCGRFLQWTSTYEPPQAGDVVHGVYATLGNYRNGYMWNLEPTGTKKLPKKKRC